MEAEAAAMEMEETTKSKKKGGLRTMPFIFANEVAEKLAVVGFQTNMLMYLTKQLHMPLAKAATTLTNFGGTSAMTPLVGAFLADAVVGRFWTITAASAIYQVGMVLLTVSAALPQFRPPPCEVGATLRGGGGGGACVEAAPWQLALLYAALFLNSLGAGGYRPCIVAFGADQFDESEAAERARTWGFFNWYYFCNGASMLLAVTAVVYVQDNVGWGWGLGVPTACMAVSVAAFAAGYPLYRRLEPSGSPFTRLAQVVVAAVRKRRLPMPDGDHPGRFYENDDMDAPISLYGKLLHTQQLSFFDRAAIVADGDLTTGDASSGKQPPSSTVRDPWRLSTVHRVEELKSVVRMGPIWAAGILVITASSTQHTFSLQQASTMDRRLAPRLSGFQIPAGSMTVFGLLAMLATLFAYDRALVPLARRATGLDRGISYLHRMGVGLAVSACATLVAGFVERHRREAAATVGTTDAGTAPLSAYWLVPQYALHGVAEAFTSVGHLEFMYDQAPESMRSTATALFWLSISLGSYASTLLVSLVHRWSAGADGSNWLPDNINRGRLDYFYWVVTLLQLMNLLYYVICARLYTFKPVQQKLHMTEEEDKALAMVELQDKV